jgi:hypothetical protein
MSTITFIAVAMMIVLASIVYEFTVIGWDEQNLNSNYKMDVPADKRVGHPP